MVKYDTVAFEWDENKENKNRKKHGISFSEAMESFCDPEGFLMSDQDHSITEKRYYWIGKSFSDRILTTRFTIKGSVIRIIGCANWRKFRRVYHETTKNQ